jgi:hypothetical protein
VTNGPYQISDRVVPINVTGYFMPSHGPHAPVLVGMGDTNDLFVCVFSTEEKLAASMKVFQIDYARVAIVTNGGELIDEMAALNKTSGRPYRVRLAVDPHKADNGRIRFVEVALPEELPEEMS